VGAVTGLVGSGGGFLVVPALAILGGLPMGIAVGTSLLVIVMNSLAGLAGHLSGVQIDWGLALAITAAAVAGSVLGARFAGRIPQDTLRRAFGWFVVVMDLFVLGQQLDTAVWTHPATWTGIGIALLAVAAARVRRDLRTRHHSHESGLPTRPDVRGRPEPKARRRVTAGKS
jgi:hypothetical protein